MLRMHACDTWLYTFAAAGTLWLCACCKLWLLALTGALMRNACELWMLEFGALWMRACGTWMYTSAAGMLWMHALTGTLWMSAR